MNPDENQDQAPEAPMDAPEQTTPPVQPGGGEGDMPQLPEVPEVPEAPEAPSLPGEEEGEQPPVVPGEGDKEDGGKW